MKRKNDRKSGQNKLSLSRETIRELNLRSVVTGGVRDETSEDPGTGSAGIGTPQQGGDLRPLCC